MPKPAEEHIRIRAHELWERAGSPEGREDEFWHRAEKELQETEELREIAHEPPPTILPGYGNFFRSPEQSAPLS
jgi:hypothetical protein